MACETKLLFMLWLESSDWSLLSIWKIHPFCCVHYLRNRPRSFP
jgi:hypothetical protein